MRYQPSRGHLSFVPCHGPRAWCPCPAPVPAAAWCGWRRAAPSSSGPGRYATPSWKLGDADWPARGRGGGQSISGGRGPSLQRLHAPRDLKFYFCPSTVCKDRCLCECGGQVRRGRARTAAPGPGTPEQRRASRHNTPLGNLSPLGSPRFLCSEGQPSHRHLCYTVGCF